MRVGVCGAGGRMGRETCKAVAAEEGLELVCAVDPAYVDLGLGELIPGIDSELVVEGESDGLVRAGVEVMVDFSVAEAARESILHSLESGIHCVVGTTGFLQEDLESFERAAISSGVGCLLAPNFAIGAVLMMDFARRAAPYMDECEIVELHHQAKLDAPSGTARNTARLILESRGETEGVEREEGPRGLNIGGIHLHSVRLPGLVAHQEVIFGGKGQTLILRHDTVDRACFMPGVIMAITNVVDLEGLSVGLESIMEL